MLVLMFLASCANQQSMDWATVLPIATGGGVLPYLIGVAIDEALPKKGKSTQLKSSDLPNICAKARDGDGTARASVAWHYKNGWAPVSVNSVEAYKWFSLASSAGYAEATDYRAALANEMTAEQIAEAERRAAAWSAKDESCNFEPEFELAKICASDRDGNGEAFSSVAWHYRNGRPPVSKDLVEAYKWFILAEDAGYEAAAQYRVDLASIMPATDITEAARRAEAWTPTEETCTFVGEIAAQNQPVEQPPLFKGPER